MSKPTEDGYAFVVLLRDGDDATGLARLLEDVRLAQTTTPSVFAAPPVRGLDFFADPIAQPDLDKWWADAIPVNALPIYLLNHEDGLNEEIKGLDGTFYIGLPVPTIAEQYPKGGNVKTFMSGGPLDFATIIMRDFSGGGDDAGDRGILFDQGEALRMAALSSDFPIDLDDSAFDFGEPEPPPAGASPFAPSPFAAPPSPFGPAQPAASPFASSPATSSPFSSPPQPAASPFSGAPQPAASPFSSMGQPASPFSGAPATPAASPFSGAPPNKPDPSPFSAPPAASPFAAGPPPASPFGPSPATSSPFGPPPAAPAFPPPGSGPAPAAPGAPGANPFDSFSTSASPFSGTPAAPAGGAPRKAGGDAAPAHPFDLLSGGGGGAPASSSGSSSGGGGFSSGPPRGASSTPASPGGDTSASPWGSTGGASGNGSASGSGSGDSTGGGGGTPGWQPSGSPLLQPGTRPERGFSPYPGGDEGRAAPRGGPAAQRPKVPKLSLPGFASLNKKGRNFVETPNRELATMVVDRGPTIVVMGSRKGGVGKTSYAAGIAIVAGTILDAVGHKAAIVDANIANPDAWGQMNLREGAATVREVVAALTANREPPPPVHATTPALAVYPESRETTEYSKTDVKRFADYLRRRYTFIVVDMSNRLPDPMAGPEAAAAAYWLEHADVLVLPTTSSKQDFNGVLDYLDVRGLPPTVVPYIVPTVKKNREHPVTQQYLSVIRNRVHRIVEIPDEADKVRYAGMEGVPVEQVSPALRVAYRELTEVIVRVPPRARI